MMRKTRRKIVLGLVGLGVVFPLSACGKGNFFVKKNIVVSAMVFNYFDRPIFDVFLNKKMIGASASLSNSPYGQFSTVTGINIPFGPQVLTWRLDGPESMKNNGMTVTMKNKITLNIEDVPSGTEMIGVHIYPDDTAEFTFSPDVLEQTERGLVYARKFQKNGK
jgi:hypothetical protein